MNPSNEKIVKLITDVLKNVSENKIKSRNIGYVTPLKDSIRTEDKSSALIPLTKNSDNINKLLIKLVMETLKKNKINITGKKVEPLVEKEQPLLNDILDLLNDAYKVYKDRIIKEPKKPTDFLPTIAEKPSVTAPTPTPTEIKEILPVTAPLQESIAIEGKLPSAPAPEQPIVAPEQPIVAPEQPIVAPEQPIVSHEQPIVEKPMIPETSECSVYNDENGKPIYPYAVVDNKCLYYDGKKIIYK